MPGGRPKGSTDKRFKTLSQILDEKGCCPELILADVAMDKNNKPEVRADAAAKLMPYRWAKLSSIELKAEIESVTHIGIEPEAINTATKIIESILSRKK
jgi:hypothetical protein